MISKQEIDLQTPFDFSFFHGKKPLEIMADLLIHSDAPAQLSEEPIPD